jgi:hypothetical protein
LKDKDVERKKFKDKDAKDEVEVFPKLSKEGLRTFKTRDRLKKNMLKSS